jgi:hypothetical protein
MYKTKEYRNCVNLQQWNQLLTFIPWVEGETVEGVVKKTRFKGQRKKL